MHGEGPDVTPVKVLNCDTISQVSLFFVCDLFFSAEISVFVLAHILAGEILIVYSPGEREDYRSGLQKSAVLTETKGGECCSG